MKEEFSLMRFFLTLATSLILVLSPGCSTTQTSSSIAEFSSEPRLIDDGLGAEEARADIALARVLYEEIHPGYTRYTDRDIIDQAWSSLLERANQQMSREILFIELSRVLALIRCDHTKAELPRDIRQARLDNPSFFPFRLMLSGEEAYVYSASSDSGLQKGDRILKIDGRPFDEIRRSVFEVIPYDGRTHFIRSSEFESSSEFLGSAFETFYPMFFGPWDQSVIQIERKGQTQTLAVNPIDWSTWRKLEWKGRPYRSDFKDSVALDIVEPGIAILKVDTFVNYRNPVDPDEMYRPVFQRLEDEEIHTLILDTRYNGGGSTDASTGLLSYLLDQPTAVFQSKRVRTIDLTEYADYIRTYDPSALSPDSSRFIPKEDGWYEVRPSSDPIGLQPFKLMSQRFEGNVIALSSISNASGITLLLALLQEKVGATILGEPTGGSSEGPTAGSLFFADLPNSGISLRIPWQLQRSAISEPIFGLGVEPDISIVPTIADRLTDSDPQLAAALEIARQTNQSKGL